MRLHVPSFVDGEPIMLDNITAPSQSPLPILSLPVFPPLSRLLGRTLLSNRCGDSSGRGISLLAVADGVHEWVDRDGIDSGEWSRELCRGLREEAEAARAAVWEAARAEACGGIAGRVVKEAGEICVAAAVTPAAHDGAAGASCSAAIIAPPSALLSCHPLDVSSANRQ